MDPTIAKIPSGAGTGTGSTSYQSGSPKGLESNRSLTISPDGTGVGMSRGKIIDSSRGTDNDFGHVFENGSSLNSLNSLNSLHRTRTLVRNTPNMNTPSRFSISPNGTNERSGRRKGSVAVRMVEKEETKFNEFLLFKDPEDDHHGESYIKEEANKKMRLGRGMRVMRKIDAKIAQRKLEPLFYKYMWFQMTRRASSW
eukprot:CAMPEP_0118669688 /NCGR_PEP_ID=MMETSP0785-20121206/21039_1 /TAXON_ID=91992 /ORGANISM="Bolidomonas pacifica, Strain CCMP 1866" /LENGTH=197 /DNA_ID=CAMNT_0006564397 /DNA_START=78 /DNA_END=672 /DNA_ORIENTATION=+